MSISHQNNFATNLTSGTTAGDTTSPINSIPTVDAPYYLAFDATNLNSHYEVKKITSDTATNVNHVATAYNHTTAEEVRMIFPAVELDNITTAKDLGWINVDDTWTRASATTITVPSGAASIYGVGDKLKFTDTTVKYFIITEVADALLTITGGSSYTLVANPSLIYYSKAENPLGFPHWFNYTPTGPTNTTLTGRFKVIGRQCFTWIHGALTGAPSFASMPTLPITASANNPVIGTYSSCGNGGYLDSGTGNYIDTISPLVDPSGTTCVLHRNTTDSVQVSATVPITWANNDMWTVQFNYEI